MKYNLHSGIIYRIHNSGDADKLINIINQEGKKISAIAKSVRKNTSKKASSIELGNYIQFKTVEGYAIPIITETKIIKEFIQWKSEYKPMLMLQLICEVIDKFVFEEIEDHILFKLVKDLLSKQNLERVEYLVAIFLLKILDLSGNLPGLNVCIETGEEINSSTACYIQGSIGYLKKGLFETSQKVSERIYKTQRYVLHSDFEKSINVSLSKEEDIQLLKLHLNWIEIAIEQELKSKPIVLSLLK